MIEKLIGTSQKKLIFWLDNCVKENKNNVFFHYLFILVHYGFFSEVLIKYKVQGHTHDRMDGFVSVFFMFSFFN